MNGKMMSTNKRNHTGRPIIFALIAFSIASMIIASIINNTNNVNNNLLAFAKKKQPGSSITRTTTTTTNPKKPSSSSSGGSGSSGTSHHIKIKKIKKTDIPSGGGAGGVVGTADNGNGVNGNPGGNGNPNGQGGKGGTGTTITTMTGNPPPPVKCKSGEVLKGGVCIIVTTPPPLCKSGKVLSDGSCVPKTPITCTPDQILMKGKCVPRPVDCKLTPGNPACVQPSVDCTKTPNDPKCPPIQPCDPKTDIKCPCPTGQHRDSNNNKCVVNPTKCPDSSILMNGVCQCPSHEHFNNRIKQCVDDTTNRPIVVHITVKPQTIRNTVVIRQSTIVHDFTEFTVNPTNSKVVIILPTQNIQDATTKNINMFGTILNTGFGTARNIGEVRATVFDKDNNILATLTAVAAAQILKSQSTTTFQLVISPNQVKLTDIKFIEFELVPLRSGSASVASSSS